MKNYRLLAGAATLLVLLFNACSKDTAPSTGGTAPKVASATVENGATEVGIDLGVIDLTYSMGIKVADASGITLTDTQIEVSAANTRLRITVPELTKGKEYTLSVASGAVVSYSDGTAAKAYTLSFTTEKEQEGPVQPVIDPDAKIPTTPVTADAIDNAKSLYSYLYSVYGNYTLSSAMARVNWNTDEADWVYKYTGKYPAIATFDYIHLMSSPCNWIDYGDITPALDWFKAGGIVSASWHWNVPTSEGATTYTYEPAKTTFQAKNVMVEGTWENKVAKADLEEMAGYLLLLQAEGIPVIWRPLHEAAGNTFQSWNQIGCKAAWFWWGYDGAEVYKQLWKFMFDYFKEKGVKNLIWVWTTQTSCASDQDYAYYPGNDYVDIVGRDIYNVTDASAIASQYSIIASYWPQRMVTLSECGNVATAADQRTAGAKWLFFMPWYDYNMDGTRTYAHEHATIEWWTKSFKDEGVITRDMLPETLYN